MNPITLFRLFFTPTRGWEDLMSSHPSIHRLYLLHVIPFALIPPIMIYIAGNNHSLLFFDLLPGNKLILVAVMFFLIQLVVVPAMASIIRQLAEIADAHPSYREAFIVAAVAPTPLWMAPVFLVVPDILVNIAVTSLAMMASAGFIYYGIPTVFKIREQGHVYLLFGAILMAGATAWGFLMVCTLVIWGSVQNLQFATGPVTG
ncbi:Inner membrane protein YohC [Methylophilaceae bacterium]|nr:Inner membrane protein YohC [Methylophilaceae bacterium]